AELVESLRGNVFDGIAARADAKGINELQSGIQVFAAELCGKQRGLQEKLDADYPGKYVALVRFYVGDVNAGVTHPDINSWAFFHKEPEKDQEDRRVVATKHMLYGHDRESQDAGVVKHSPCISTTEDVISLLLADNPDNPNRDLAMMSTMKRRDQQVSGQRRQAPPVMYVSDAIAALIFGWSNAS